MKRTVDVHMGDTYMTRDKYDGKRIVVAINASDVRISNKSAIACSMPAPTVQAIRSLTRKRPDS